MANKTGKGGFSKGKSGNPGGRPKQAEDVKALAATHTDKAIARLAEWMDSSNPKASIQACVALLNRAWGMPTAPVEHGGSMTVVWPLGKSKLDE